MSARARQAGKKKGQAGRNSTKFLPGLLVLLRALGRPGGRRGKSKGAVSNTITGLLYTHHRGERARSAGGKEVKTRSALLIKFTPFSFLYKSPYFISWWYREFQCFQI